MNDKVLLSYLTPEMNDKMLLSNSKPEMKDNTFIVSHNNKNE